jgi:hypothetical protein
MQLASVWGDGPAPPGHPAISKRLANVKLSGWRILPTSPTGTTPFQIVAPQNYYIKDPYGSGVLHATSWAFAAIDKQLAETPVTVPRLIQQDPPFPLWHCPSGSWTSPGTGCDLSGPSGLSDPSYRALARFYAGMVAYYTQGILLSGSGATSYTPSTLTDRGRSFAGKAGDCVTATVLDAWGYPDWVTGTIASVGGPGNDTVTLVANWSTAESFDTNSGSSVTRNLTARAPASGAAYNVASCTPPRAIASPTAATPWPVPPSVVMAGTTGNINFEIPVNEPDLNRILGSSYPSAPSPSFTLTGVNVSGGTLTPGSSYTYEVSAAGDQGRENVPSTAQSITLPAGDNAVQVSWSPTSDDAMPSFAYVVYGRTSGHLAGLAAVGKDAAGGMAWTDKGTVTPSGSPQSSDQSKNESFDPPGVNVAIWNAVAPAMRAVDPGVGLVGPAIANPTSVYSPWSSVDTSCVTSSGLGSGCVNGDSGWLSSED